MMEEVGRFPCRLGCGGRLKTKDAVDHGEVCSLASVVCLLQAHGCRWRGPRPERRRHLQTCPLWQVKCPVCCQAVHRRDFGSHVLCHSADRDRAALHPPGCALRAYGCRSCRAPTAMPIANATANRRYGDGGGYAAAGVQSNDLSTVGIGSSYEAAAAEAAATVAEITSEIAAEAAAAQVAEETAETAGNDRVVGVAMAATERAEEVHCPEKAWVGEETDVQWGAQDRECAHGNAGVCQWYKVICKSCEQEVVRKEWDAGGHSCPVQWGVDVFANHALRAA